MIELGRDLDNVEPHDALAHGDAAQERTDLLEAQQPTGAGAMTAGISVGSMPSASVDR